MRIIGITGGIASGKSTVSNYIKSLGYTVFDADACSRSLTAKCGAALPAIAATFGSDYIVDHTLDRKKMSQLVFENQAARKTLESILHPMVIAQCNTLMHNSADEQLFVIDAPLLLESGMDSLCDETWVVYAPQRVIIERAQARSGLTATEIRKRIRSQMPFYLKRQRANHIIDNGGTLEATLRRTDRLLKQALKRAKEETA